MVTTDIFTSQSFDHEHENIGIELHVVIYSPFRVSVVTPICSPSDT